METQQGETAPPTGVDAGIVTRRTFLKFGVAAVVASMPYIAPAGANIAAGSAFGEGDEHHPEPSEPEPQDHPQEGQHGTVDASSEHPGAEVGEDHAEHISLLNATTAGMVGVVFGRQVALNTQYNPETGKGRTFGFRSWGEMATAESTRLLTLQLFGNELDKEQAAHELKDIGISYGLMGGLTAIAEATAHVEADEQALFDGVATMMERDQEEVSNMTPDALDSNAQEWDKYYKSTKNRVVELVAENLAIGTTIAPLATTYTSATLVNAMNKRVASSLAEHSYARLVSEAKRSGEELTQDRLFEFMTQAAEEASAQMNGPMGYVKKSLLEGANIQGAALIGDPPNGFYIRNNGVKEWLKASVYGFGVMNTVAVANTEIWLAKTLGPGVLKRPDVLIGAMVKATGKIAKGTFKSILNPDYSFLRFKKISRKLEEVLNSEDGNFTAEDAAQARQILTQMPRTAFAYDARGLKRAFKSIGGSREYNEARSVAEMMHYELHDEDAADNGSVSGYLMRKFANDLKHNRSPAFMREFLSAYMGEERDWRIEKLADVLDGMLGAQSADHPEQARLDEEYAAKISEVVGETTPEQASQTADIEGRLTQVMESGMDRESKSASITELLNEFSDRYSFVDKDIREALVRIWSREIGANAVAGHEEKGGLSHAAREVFSALATQILAANAAAVAARKFLEMLDGKIPFERQNELVMTFAAALSGFADNVVAYVFCENVLLSQFKKQYGPDIFEHQPELKNEITRAALLTAIIGGALTKIGNGPNFKFEKPIVKARRDLNKRFEVQMDELTLKDTLINPMAWGDAAAIIGINTYKMHYTHKIKDPRRPNNNRSSQPERRRRDPSQYVGAAGTSKYVSSGTPSL